MDSCAAYKLQEDKTYTICQLFDLTIRTTRFYEDEALLSPLRKGHKPIYRHTRLKLVLRGKRLGFSLTEIREMFALYD